jgi:hypothetical protein
MGKRFAIFLLVCTGLVQSASLATAGDHGTTAWCNLTTTGVPGGTINFRLAAYGFKSDPQTARTIFYLAGINTGNSANVTGYAHTTPGTGFPLRMSLNESVTLSNAFTRAWALEFNQTLNATTRVLDVTTGGTFTAVGQASINCQ